MANVPRKRFDWTPFQSDRWTATDIGDEIVGRVVALDVKDGRSGPVPVIIIRERESQKDREVWASTHLAQLLAENDAQPGLDVAIRLVELRHTGQPSPMKIFDLKVGATPAAQPVTEDDPSVGPEPPDDEPY